MRCPPARTSTNTRDENPSLRHQRLKETSPPAPRVKDALLRLTIRQNDRDAGSATAGPRRPSSGDPLSPVHPFPLLRVPSSPHPSGQGLGNLFTRSCAKNSSSKNGTKLHDAFPSLDVSPFIQPTVSNLTINEKKKSCLASSTGKGGSSSSGGDTDTQRDTQRCTGQDARTPSRDPPHFRVLFHQELRSSRGTSSYVHIS